MSEAIFFEKKSKKLISLTINFVLVFGLIFIPIPGGQWMPTSLGWVDTALTILFGVPFLLQLYYIFEPTYLKWNERNLSENITLIQHAIPSTEIVGYRFIKLALTKYIIVDLRSPDDYIKSLSGWKRWIAKYDFKQVKSPVKIPLNRLEKPISEIYESIKQVHEL